jgi:hypothetical protein
VVRGTATSLERAQDAMNTLWSKRVNEARKLGLVSHEVFVRLAPPDSTAAPEIIGVDMWSNREGFNQIYADPSFMQSFDGVFTAPAATWILQRPAGDWVEW